MIRVPLSPAEFDAACRELERLRPDLSCTSGTRTPGRDSGFSKSGALGKHRRPYACARDYVSDRWMALGSEEALELVALAQSLGLWAIYHASRGGGPHLHVQGIPPGEASAEWLAKYGAPTVRV